MHSFGEHVFNSTQIKFYQNTDKLGKNLTNFMVEFRKIIEREFPWELLSMLSHQESFGESPPQVMAGKKGITKSIKADKEICAYSSKGA